MELGNNECTTLAVNSTGKEETLNFSVRKLPSEYFICKIVFEIRESLWIIAKVRESIQKKVQNPSYWPDDDLNHAADAELLGTSCVATACRLG